MSEEETEAPKRKGYTAERIDELFGDSRLKIEMILTVLAEKLGARVQELSISAESLVELESLLAHLERVIFLGQMNRAKTRDLLHMAPKKYQRVLSDAELIKELRPVRDETNFPKRGPRGPREDAAQETEET